MEHGGLAHRPDLPGRRRDGRAAGAARSGSARSSATSPPASPSGPWGLGLVSDAEDILHFAEFGVVLMLFLVGLELEPQRLWALRRPIFGWGSVQVLGSALLLVGAACCARRRLAARRWSPRSAWRCRPPRSASACWPSAT